MCCNSNPKPTETTDSYFLHEYDVNVAQNYPFPEGKWMQFYNRAQLDAMWDLAKSKYHQGKLHGIHSMKVSTALSNPRARGTDQGVIIFYCGPLQDEMTVLQYGRNILKEIPYSDPSGWMVYKSEEQTSAGTAAIGQRRNFTYRLQCPKN